MRLGTLSAGPRVLLVDLSNVTYRAVCSHVGLSHDGVDTGGVYGFLQIVCKLVNDNRVTRLVVADDSKPYHRATYFPSYKGNRKSMKGPATSEVGGYVKSAKKQIAEVLQRLGVGVVAVPGYEADDIIARAAMIETRDGGHVFIGSNDSDLYQCLLSTNQVMMCKKDGVYSYRDFRTEYGVLPVEWPRVLALCGSHNGVPGISGVGLKTAAKLVQQAATSRFVQHKYHVSVADQRLRERLATYPWHNAEQPLPRVRGVQIKHDRRRITAWLHQRFGIEFAPYMHSAFESLAS